MKNKSYFIIIYISVLFLLNCKGRRTNNTFGNLNDSISGLTYINPVMDTTFPDPAIIKAQDGCYYAYATQGFYPGTKFNNIQLARSVDLIHWKYLGDAMPTKPSWTKKNKRFGHLTFIFLTENILCILLLNMIINQECVWESL